MSDYAIKLGDDDPPFEVILKGADELPADLTGVTEMRIAVRDAGTEDWKLTGPADIVNIAQQSLGDANRGRVRVSWTADQTYAMGVGDKEAEFQAVRSGRRVSWPTEGYVPFVVWKDIVPDS